MLLAHVSLNCIMSEMISFVCNQLLSLTKDSFAFHANRWNRKQIKCYSASNWIVSDMLLPPFKRILYVLIFHSNTTINKPLPFNLHLPLLLCSIGISDMTISSYIILGGRP